MFSLLAIDVNNLQWIYVVLGQEDGDRAIIAVAAVLERERRATDEAARSGTGEFLVLMPATEAQVAQRLAERIRDALVDVPLEAENATISVGIGIAEAGSGMDCFAAMLRLADECLRGKPGSRASSHPSDAHHAPDGDSAAR